MREIEMLFKGVVAYLFKNEEHGFHEVVEIEACNIASAKRQLSRRFGNKYHNGGLHHSLVSVTLVDDEGYIVCKKVHRHWEYPYYSQVEKTVKWADWFVGSKQAKYSF